MSGPALRRLRAVIKKEVRQISRDVRSLLFMVFLPAFMLLLFGFALNFDVKHVPLAVVDQDRSRASRALIDAFRTTEYFDLVTVLDRTADVDPLMARERVRVALVVPARFAEDLLSGRSVSVQVLLDGSNAMSGSTAAGYVASVLQSFSESQTIERLESKGLSRLEWPLQAEVRVWYNPELRSAKFLVPGLMAFILMVILTVSTAFSVVREKERGTMEQILISPLRPGELITGKLLPYALISLASAHSVLILGHGLFGIRVRGSYGLLLLTMVLFLLGALGQGILISTVTRTQQVAFLIAILTTFLPTFILSGFVFPIRNMPLVIQAITYLVPARYFLAALRAIILKGAGLEAFWREVLFLAAFAMAALAASTARLRRGEAEARRPARRAP